MGGALAQTSHVGNVVVADDDDDVRNALAAPLRKAGIDVTEASNGVQVLDLIDRMSVDVVVSDIHMPDMTGVELLQSMHERHPDIPVLLVTGAPQIETAMTAVQYGAFEYLSKPVDIDRLRSSVRRAIERHRVTVERHRLVELGKRPRGECSIGDRLGGKYRLVEVLGSGGMGTVYKAVREDLADMQVAVKVLHDRLIRRPDTMARFRREAQVVASMNHPNIVKILDFDASAEGPYLVMELLSGVSLSYAIEHEPPFSQERVASIAAQVLSALCVVHAAGVVHRDLKPENVFLTSVAGMGEVVKVLDFGIAKLVGIEHKLTDTGLVVGTPSYIPPESARGVDADVRGDIYTLGCLMYEALTRRQPHAGANYNALLYAIQVREPDPIQQIRNDVADDFCAVVLRALSKDPDQRFQSASDMELALAPWLPPTVSHPHPNSPPIALAPTELASRKT